MEVARLLGRPPATAYRIAVRCPYGGPAVLENDPTDLAGTPFPTRYWLACRALGVAVSRLEASGGVRALEADPDLSQAIADAHERHVALHGGHRVGGVGDPRRVKCLHAQLAFAIAEGGNPIGDWIAERTELDWPAVCCAAADAA